MMYNNILCFDWLKSATMLQKERLQIIFSAFNTNILAML